jgi:hypothetical protein
LDFHDSLAKRRVVILSLRQSRAATILFLLVLLGGGAVLWAQIEGGERGVAPVDSSSSYEVGGVMVDVSAKTSEAARVAGWRVAQRKAWALLWSRTNGQPVSAAPKLPDSTLDSMVGGIVVENEQIGPTRYIARLGVLFDRARTGQFLGVKGQIMRSPPMLVIPVMWSGGQPQSFEGRTEWQKAWARFRSGGSPIDYVRTSGTGSDPLLLNAAQTKRPGRTWWRMILDTYGAADIVVPEAYVYRRWPGGPVTARFIARHGPDGEVIDIFTLSAPNGDAFPAMMDEAVRRVDEAYSRALRDGRLKPDPSLVIEETPEELPEELLADETVTETLSIAGAAYTVQVDTPDPRALEAAEAGIRALPGVRASTTTSLALGGLSVIRVTFDGDAGTLRSALSARGWKVEDVGGGVLRIRRNGASAPPAGPPPSQ